MSKPRLTIAPATMSPTNALLRLSLAVSRIEIEVIQSPGIDRGYVLTKADFELTCFLVQLGIAHEEICDRLCKFSRLSSPKQRKAKKDAVRRYIHRLGAQGYNVSTARGGNSNLMKALISAGTQRVSSRLQSGKLAG